MAGRRFFMSLGWEVPKLRRTRRTCRVVYKKKEAPSLFPFVVTPLLLLHATKFIPMARFCLCYCQTRRVRR